jgi:gliding motility-associated-like protein
LPTTVSVLNSSAGASDFSMSIPGYPTYENFLSPLVLDVEFPGYYNAEFSVSNTHTIGSHEVTCTVETEYIKAFQGRTPPVAEFAVLPDTLVEYVNPVVEFVNLSEGQIENIWSFGNGEGSSELDPEVEYEAAGTYNAQLLVVNEFGCTDVFTQPIEVFTDLYVYVPTSFTPNNDGLNDAWAPSIIGQDIIAKYDCWVFNRTGHTVFHTNDPNKAWIGGNDLSGEGLHYSGGAEVFVWRIAIKKKDGEGAKVYEGHVTMVR